GHRGDQHPRLRPTHARVDAIGEGVPVRHGRSRGGQLALAPSVAAFAPQLSDPGARALDAAVRLHDPGSRRPQLHRAWRAGTDRRVGRDDLDGPPGLPAGPLVDLYISRT